MGHFLPFSPDEKFCKSIYVYKCNVYEYDTKFNTSYIKYE